MLTSDQHHNFIACPDPRQRKLQLTVRFSLTSH